MSKKRKHLPFEVRRDGNLLVAEVNSWQRPARRAEEPRPALFIFLVVVIGTGPERWTIGWVKAFEDAKTHAGRVKTIRTKGLALASLPGEDGAIPFRVERLSIRAFRKLALERAESISVEATRITEERAHRLGRTACRWDLTSTQAKLEKAVVDIKRLA